MATEREELERLRAKYMQPQAPAGPPIPEVVTPGLTPRQMTGALLTMPIEGATLGHAGELRGAMFAPLEMARQRLQGGASQGLLSDLGQAYQTQRRAVEAPYGRLEQEAPYATLAGEIAGGLPTGGLLGAKALATGYGRMHPLLTGAGVGAGTGAAVGAGKAPTLAEVPGQAATGAAIGGAGGMIVPPLITGAARGGQAVARGIGRMLQGPRAEAVRQAKDLMALDDTLPSRLVAELRQMGPEARLQDVAGPNVRSAGEALAVSPGRTQRVAKGMLERRRETALDRMESAMQRLTGQSGKFLKEYRNILKQRSNDAAPWYNAAKTEEVPVERMQGVVDYIDQKLIDFEGTAIGNPLRRLRRMLYTGTGDNKRLKTNVGVQLHEVKRDFDDIMRRLPPNRYREAKRAKEKLLEAMSPPGSFYDRARQIYADDSLVKDAAEAGRDIFKPSMDVEELVEKMAQKRARDPTVYISEAERDAYLLGAAKAIRDKLQQTVGGLPGQQASVARIARTPELRERLRVAFPDDDAYDEFMEIVAREQTFQDTASQVLRQSATYGRQAAARALPTGPVDAARRIAHWALERMRQDPQVVVDELGKIIWELGPDELQRALRTAGLSAKAIRGLMERVRGTAAAAAGQAGVLFSAQNAP